MRIHPLDLIYRYDETWRCCAQEADLHGHAGVALRHASRVGHVGIARAEVFDAYTIGMVQWAKPIAPDQVLDADTIWLGDTISDLVTISVYQDLDGEEPARADVVGFCEDLAGAFYPKIASPADVEVELPASFDNAFGYASGDAHKSTSVICSLHGEAIYVFMLFSTNADAGRTQSVLTGIARDVLEAGPPYDLTLSRPSFFEGRGGERPLADLPGRDDLPAGFQFVDRDYVVVE